MLEVLSVVAILIAGLMVGSELAIAVFVHPTLDKLPDDVHLPVASALARVQGMFMPLWYILVVLLTLAEVAIQWYQSGNLPIWIATSAVLWILAILYSVTSLVPINNRIKSNPPPDWKTYRRRWDLLHRWRVVLLTIALAFLSFHRAPRAFSRRPSVFAVTLLKHHSIKDRLGGKMIRYMMNTNFLTEVLTFQEV